MNVERKRDFDGFTYERLTDVARNNIDKLREYKQFKISGDSQKYPKLRMSLFLKHLSWETDIKGLMKMRRVLKGSALTHWDTKFFELQEKILGELE